MTIESFASAIATDARGSYASKLSVADSLTMKYNKNIADNPKSSSDGWSPFDDMISVLIALRTGAQSVLSIPVNTEVSKSFLKF